MLAEQGRGISPKASKILAECIDRVVDERRPGGEDLEEQCEREIKELLKQGGMDPLILERLKISYVEPEKRKGWVGVQGNRELDLVKVAAFGILGQDVLRRVDLSLGD